MHIIARNLLASRLQNPKMGLDKGFIVKKSYLKRGRGEGVDDIVSSSI